jgi:Xaa-Pro dipeptidase
MRRQNPFPAEEYESRLRRVREQMARRDVECLLVTSPGNVCYLTGYQTFGEAAQFLLVPAAGDVVFVLRELESLLVGYTTWSGDLVRYADHEDPLQAVVDTVRARGLAGESLAVEEATGTLAPAAHRELGRRLGGLRLTAADGVVEACRAVKSPAEIAACRQAARITCIGMKAAVDACVRGATENTVAAAAAEAMMTGGSEWFANDPIVTSGYRSGIPHTTYARRALEPGDTVLLELGACFHRYFGPLMRTVTVGPADPEVARMHQACQDALEAALKALRPGVTSGAAHAACQEVIDDHGYHDLFRKRLGYAVGIGFQTWSEGRIFDLKAGDERTVERGMVLHLPPALRVPNVLGVGLSETVVVTDDGCECLTDFPRRLFAST